MAGISLRGELDACRLKFPRESLLNALNGGALLRNLAHLDDDTVVEHRAALCNFNRFVETAGIHEEIAADCFFGLGEWSVGDDSTFGAGDDARLFRERLSGFNDPTGSESLKPGKEGGHRSLELFGGEGVVPGIAAEEEKVFVGGVGGAHGRGEVGFELLGRANAGASFKRRRKGGGLDTYRKVF